jgi:mannosyltransferase OCH1-like enzyme
MGALFVERMWKWQTNVSLFSVCVAVIAIVLVCFVSMGAGRATLFNGESGTLSAFVSTRCKLRACVDVSEHQNIPRIIYRTGPSRAVLTTPGSTKEAWDFTAKNNPDYTQQFFDDDEMAEYMRTAMNGEVHTTFERLTAGAAKADLFRYTILYERGGVYLDIKSGARKLCSLIRPQDRMLVSTWGHNIWTFDHPEIRPEYGELQQWWLVAEPRHPAMLDVVRAVIDNVNNYKQTSLSSFDSRIEILKTTGPICFANALDKYLQDDNGGVRLVCAHGNNVMVYDVKGDHPSGSFYSGLKEFISTQTR